MSESTHHAPAPQQEQIYRIVDPSKITPMGDTWLLNPQLTYTSDQAFFAVPFYSNGKLYHAISHYIKKVFTTSSMTVLRSIVATHFGLMMNIALSPLLLN